MIIVVSIRRASSSSEYIGIKLRLLFCYPLDLPYNFLFSMIKYSFSKWNVFFSTNLPKPPFDSPPHQPPSDFSPPNGLGASTGSSCLTLCTIFGFSSDLNISTVGLFSPLVLLSRTVIVRSPTVPVRPSICLY